MIERPTDPTRLTAYDVAAQRELERGRPLDWWRRGNPAPDIDEGFLVTVGEEPEPVEPEPPDSEVDDAEEMVSNTPKEQPRGWQTTEEILRLYNPSDLIKMLDGEPAVGTTVSIVEGAGEEVKVCAFCKKPISPLELVSGPSYGFRHGTCGFP